MEEKPRRKVFVDGRTKERRTHAEKLRTATTSREAARTSSPLLKAAFERIDGSGMLYKDIAVQCGIHANTISHWKHGFSSPRVQDLESVLQVIGVALQLKVNND